MLAAYAYVILIEHAIECLTCLALNDNKILLAFKTGYPLVGFNGLCVMHDLIAGHPRALDKVKPFPFHVASWVVA